jgi:hypothetical protein
MTYSLQTADTIDSDTWSVVSATFVPVAGSPGVYAVNLSQPNTQQQFYRVVGIPSAVTPEDPDGDGLLAALEASLGTNANLFDTDGDGVSDGVEFKFGTNPLDRTSFPVLTSLPRAEFAESLSLGTEGSGPFGVTVRFDKPYFGTLEYAILTNSTALPDVHFQPLPLSLTVAGTTAVIPITWIDDAVISPDRLLFLEIRTDASLPYARGGQTRHTVLLGENDAWWLGVLSDKYAQRNFMLKLEHVGGITRATFAAGAGNDGLPLLASDTNAVKSSQSEGVIPVGTFPATVEFDDSTHFKITSPPMPASTGGLFGESTGLTRTLVLESQPTTSEPLNGHEIIPGRVIGSYSECLRVPDQEDCVTQTGLVVLVKQIPARAEVVQ